MPSTLEDHERRIAALEKAADIEQNIIRAVSRIVSESEARLTGRIGRCETQIVGLRTDMNAIEQRLTERIDQCETRISAGEERFTNLLNERFDAVMVALDRRHNPPK